MKIPSLGCWLLASSVFIVSAFAAKAGTAPDMGGKGGLGKGGGGVSSIRQTPFRAEVSLRGGYDDNVSTSPDPVDSWFSSIYGSVTADFSKPRTQFSIGLSGGATRYFDLPNNEWDYTATLNLALTHRATSRLTLTARVYATYQVEPDYSLQLGNERRNGQYFYFNSQFAARYQWSRRFSTVTSYGLSTVFYEEKASGSVNDRFEHFFSQEFRLLLAPQTTGVAEYRFGYYDYQHNDIRDGSSHYALLGVDQVFNPRLNASVRAGAEYRDTNSLSTVSPYAEGTLSYSYGRYSSISWINRFGFEQSDLGNSSERRTFRTGLRVNHGFTPKLSAFVSAYYHRNDYDGASSFSENVYDLGTGVNFAVNRTFSLNAGYSYTQVDTAVAFREYERNRFTLGGTVSF